MRRCRGLQSLPTSDLFERRLGSARPPSPGVAKPQSGQDLQFGCLWPAIHYADLDKNVLWSVLGIFHKYVEVAIFVEHSGVQQFVFHVVTIAAFVRLNQIGVGVGGLRIFVQILHVGMGRRAVKVEVIFLNVFAVVALAVGQPEHAFFKDRVFTVPQAYAEAKHLPVIADPGKTTFSPMIGAGPGLVMAEVVPRVTVVAVVLANCAPLPFAEIGAPPSPRNLGCSSLVESNVFLITVHGWSYSKLHLGGALRDAFRRRRYVDHEERAIGKCYRFLRAGGAPESQ